MAKTDYSEFVVILDRSGSMITLKDDHEGGLNSFVKDQREIEGDARFTLIQFDTQDPCEVVYDGTPIAEVGPCTLVPRGGTPLLDAIGLGVSHVSTRIGGLKNSDKPDQVVVMIITDGEENSSREWTKNRVRDLIKAREQKDGWKFIFLGAKIDAFAEAGKIGIAAASTLNVASSHIGTRNSYDSLTSNAKRARFAIQSGESPMASYDWSPDQIKGAMEVGDDEAETSQPPKDLSKNKKKKARSK